MGKRRHSSVGPNAFLTISDPETMGKVAKHFNTKAMAIVEIKHPPTTVNSYVKKFRVK
jgi:hypothetical protein